MAVGGAAPGHDAPQQLFVQPHRLAGSEVLGGGNKGFGLRRFGGPVPRQGRQQLLGDVLHVGAALAHVLVLHGGELGRQFPGRGAHCTGAALPCPHPVPDRPGEALVLQHHGVDAEHLRHFFSRLGGGLLIQRVLLFRRLAQRLLQPGQLLLRRARRDIGLLPDRPQKTQPCGSNAALHAFA